MVAEKKRAPRRVEAQERTVMLSARVPESLRKDARRYALEHGTSVQNVMIQALKEYLKGK